MGTSSSKKNTEREASGKIKGTSVSFEASEVAKPGLLKRIVKAFRFTTHSVRSFDIPAQKYKIAICNVIPADPSERTKEGLSPSLFLFQLSTEQ